ncbi:hypothetical protein VTK56DRAFT_4014 [Thermocarpiscus australiensis]
MKRLINSLLISLGLRRPNEWEPPTLLDHLLASPLQALAARLYRLLLALRGRPFAPPPRGPPIRVVCLSDTHGGVVPDVPDGDLLIHCGDLSDGGTRAEIQAQVDWLRSLGHRHKVITGGNHDAWFDLGVRRREDVVVPPGAGQQQLDLDGVEYLGARLVELTFEGDRKLNVYGWGGVPRCGEGFAFQYERRRNPWWLPDETDVLVTHTPPAHHLDLGLGCDKLLDQLWRVKPKLHVFGHVHWGYGREPVYYDECQRAYEALMKWPAKGLFYDLIPSARWLDAFAMVYHGVGSILWKWLMAGPGANNGGLLVNASVMYGNTGQLRNPVVVVDL